MERFGEYIVNIKPEWPVSIHLPGQIQVYENKLLDRTYCMILKEERQIIVGDYYKFLYSVFSFDEATELCFQIAKERVEKEIDNIKPGTGGKEGI